MTPEEQTEYEAHALLTREFLEAMGFSGELLGVEAIAPYHHKGFRGGGFPPGPPEGEDLPLGARIIGVADALWVNMSSRWGRTPMAQEEAVAWVRERAGTDFDPGVVEALARLAPDLLKIRDRGIGLG